MEKNLRKIKIVGIIFPVLVLTLFYPVWGNDLLASVNKKQDTSDLELVRERVREDLLDEEVDEANIADLLNNLQENGSWPDINYQDVSRTGFEHSRHLSNLQEMSLAFEQKLSPYYRNDQLKSAINKALDFWLANDFICDNWWWNQIGTPRRLVETFLVMDDHISEERKKEAAPIIGRANLNAWGARPGGDRIKIAAILGKTALLNRDSATLTKVIDTMNEEIHFAYQRATPDDKRGLQTDYSFHHRKDRVTSTLSYGRGYAQAFADWAAKVGGTSYHFSDESMQLLVDFFLDGISKTTAYAKFPDPGAKNRSLSRVGTLAAYGPKLPQNLRKATDYRADELSQVIDSREGKGIADIAFNKFFWHTEYMSHQRPDFFASVRMFSSRNHTMEVPYNGEGLRNHHLGEGANFITRKGDEYLDIFPLLDWQKIPGTTVVQKLNLPPADQIQKRGLTDFVGGVTDGHYGMAAFDFISPLDSLKAKKAWFFFENEYVSLGSGIQAEQALPVVTTLNQSYLKGEVVYSKKGKVKNLAPGDHRLKKIDWIIHDSIAYIFPKKNSVRLLNDTVSGSWKRINKQNEASDETIQGEIFKLWQEHGQAPKDASYAYIVLPAVAKNDVNSFHEDIPLTIIANTPELQAVKHNELNITQLSFYNPASIKLSDKHTLSLEQAGLIMLEENDAGLKKVSVSDPSRKLQLLSFSINGFYTTDSEQVESKQEESKTHFKIKLPKGEYAGQSVTFTLKQATSNMPN